SGVVAAVRAFVGVSGALILLASVATAVSGFGRLAYSLGEHGMLPRRFGRLGRRTHIAPESIVAAVVIAVALLVGVNAAAGHPVIFLASLFSFGVLLAFVAEHVASPDEQELPEPELGSILVPMKIGLIGEEMLATAIKLAQERGSAVEALHVIRVPLEAPLESVLDEAELRAAESLEEAQALG